MFKNFDLLSIGIIYTLIFLTSVLFTPVHSQNSKTDIACNSSSDCPYPYFKELCKINFYILYFYV